MRKTLLTFTIVATAMLLSARASTLLPYLDPIDAEIINQQVILSNNPPVDRALATALRKARTSIERTTPTNLVNDTKALASVAATLNKTSLSNTFDPLIRTALGNYVGEVENALNTTSNALLLTFPSGPHTAANNIIGLAFDSIEAAQGNVNTTLATKGLAVVTKKVTVVNNLLTKAENAHAPPVQLRATIAATPEGTFAFQPTPAKAAVAVLSGSTLGIIGVQVQRITTTSVRVRTLTITIPNITDGTHIYNVSNNGGDAMVIYTISQGAPGVPPSGDAYTATSGTLTVTYNSGTKAAVGTFTFSGPGANNAVNTASSDNGVFSIVAQ